MANFADPDNSMFLSPSKNAFLLNAPVSQECGLLEHGLLSWERDKRGRGTRERKKERKVQVSKIKC